MNDCEEANTFHAAKEHRSLTQEAIVLIKQGIRAKMGNKERRRRTLERLAASGIDGSELPDPVDIVRQDRER